MLKDGAMLHCSEDRLPTGFSGSGECLAFSSKDGVFAFLSSAARGCMAFSGSWRGSMLGRLLEDRVR